MALEALGWKVVTLWECDILSSTRLHATLDERLPDVRIYD